jgi:DNA-binding transcriptional regulator YdaS (Cro superfamily)
MDKALKAAIEKVGNRSILAEKLGISRQAVWSWDRVPIDRIAAVERITGIPREKLRPEIFAR